MKVVQFAAPASEPVTLDEFKLHLRGGETAEADLLNQIIQAAREHVEDITRRALFTQTWDYYLRDFPSADRFKLPFGKLQTVTHIKYTDSNGDHTTMTADTDYIVETNGDQCGEIVLPYGDTWPSFTKYPSNPIVTRFVCGWDDVDDIPAKIKAALLLIATDLYENREAQQYGNMDYSENTAVMRLLASERLWDEFL